jgi:hypothetical protein
MAKKAQLSNVSFSLKKTVIVKVLPKDQSDSEASVYDS